MNLKIEIWIAIAAAAAAWIAAIFAYHSNRLARRALDIQEKDQLAQRSNLVPYLIHALSRHDDDNDTRIVAFCLSVSNRSKRHNAISQLELRVTYSNSGGPVRNIIVPHEPSLSHAIVLSGSGPFSIPTRISSHDTITGWALFELKYNLISTVDIDKYEVLFHDSRGEVREIEPIIIKEIADAD